MPFSSFKKKKNHNFFAYKVDNLKKLLILLSGSKINPFI